MAVMVALLAMAAAAAVLVAMRAMVATAGLAIVPMELLVVLVLLVLVPVVAALLTLARLGKSSGLLLVAVGVLACLVRAAMALAELAAHLVIRPAREGQVVLLGLAAQQGRCLGVGPLMAREVSLANMAVAAVVVGFTTMARTRSTEPTAHPKTVPCA